MLEIWLSARGVRLFSLRFVRKTQGTMQKSNDFHTNVQMFIKVCPQNIKNVFLVFEQLIQVYHSLLDSVQNMSV